MPKVRRWTKRNRQIRAAQKRRREKLKATGKGFLQMLIPAELHASIKNHDPKRKLQENAIELIVRGLKIKNGVLVIAEESHATAVPIRKGEECQ